MQQFQRVALLLGEEKVNRLLNCRIAVFGLGGVGSHCAEALARSGVGHLTLVDKDFIETSNINRQVHALLSTVGQPKVEAMAERLRQVNTEISLTLVQQFVGKDNAASLVDKELDYVVDAMDTVTAKLGVIEACLQKNIPVISCMGTGNKVDPLTFEIVDISETHTCPLARAVRKCLRQRGILSGVTVVYSPQKPLKPAGMRVDHGERTPPGSVSYVPPIAGYLMAGKVIQDLLKL